MATGGVERCTASQVKRDLSITTHRASYVGAVRSRIVDRMTTSDLVHRRRGGDPAILWGLEGVHRDTACLYES